VFLSIFDIFKKSVGPSSSHTTGPMLAARRFLAAIAPLSTGGGQNECELYGSLAYTGKAHGTHRAVLCGLLGCTPETYDREAAANALNLLMSKRRFVSGGIELELDPTTAIHAERGTRLPGHPNGMRFRLVRNGATVYEETYYSVGGGFVVSEAEIADERKEESTGPEVPFPFSTAAEMLMMGRRAGLTIAAMKRHNEVANLPDPALDERVFAIWEAMDSCIDRGLAADGVLPGGSTSAAERTS
jgi:L-serine dehydratase